MSEQYTMTDKADLHKFVQKWSDPLGSQRLAVIKTKILRRISGVRRY